MQLLKAAQGLASLKHLSILASHSSGGANAAAAAAAFGGGTTSSSGSTLGGLEVGWQELTALAALTQLSAVELPSLRCDMLCATSTSAPALAASDRVALWGAVGGIVHRLCGALH
jgi:hypothetical protein